MGKKKTEKGPPDGSTMVAVAEEDCYPYHRLHTVGKGTFKAITAGTYARYQAAFKEFEEAREELVEALAQSTYTEKRYLPKP
jgi:hypothetical protein